MIKKLIESPMFFVNYAKEGDLQNFSSVNDSQYTRAAQPHVCSYTVPLRCIVTHGCIRHTSSTTTTCEHALEFVCGTISTRVTRLKL